MFDGMENKPRGFQPGQPCSPGCASHLSHPCEGCGRYAAGMRQGPDVSMASAYIRKLAMTNPIIAGYMKQAQIEGWSALQLMLALVIALEEHNRELIKRAIEALEGRPHL